MKTTFIILSALLYQLSFGQLAFQINPSQLVFANYLQTGPNLTNLIVWGGFSAPDGVSMIGNGFGVTNLNASSIASGTISDSRLSPDVVLQYSAIPWTNTSGLLIAGSLANAATIGMWDANETLNQLTASGNALLWNWDPVVTNNASGVNLQGTFSGKFSGAMTNDSGQPYGASGLITNGIQNSSMFAAGANYLAVGINAIVNTTNGGIAIGINSQATGTNSTALGKNAIASGPYSTSSGTASTASGSYSTASGYALTSSGTASTASGYASTASGYASTASGTSSTASGYASTASGYTAKSASSNSIAIGPYSYVPANATNGIAVGDNASAAATNSSAWGANSTNGTPNSIKFGYEGFPGYQVITPGTVNATNGYISIQPSATSFNWAVIPYYSSSVTNYWIGTWTNGFLCAIYSNTASTYAIKQIAP